MCIARRRKNMINPQVREMVRIIMMLQFVHRTIRAIRQPRMDQSEILQAVQSTLQESAIEDDGNDTHNLDENVVNESTANDMNIGSISSDTETSDAETSDDDLNMNAEETSSETKLCSKLEDGK